MMSPFVKELKNDLNQGCEYLNFLHISVKYVKACACETRSVHIYCMTAKIIKNEKIFCD